LIMDGHNRPHALPRLPRRGFLLAERNQTMATEAQIAANRANAELSTLPESGEGKAHGRIQ